MQLLTQRYRYASPTSTVLLSNMQIWTLRRLRFIFTSFLSGSFKTVLHWYQEKHGWGDDTKRHNSRKQCLKNMNRSAMKLWMKLQGGNSGVCRRLGKGWESAQLKWGASHCALQPGKRYPGCPKGEISNTQARGRGLSCYRILQKWDTQGRQSLRKRNLSVRLFAAELLVGSLLPTGATAQQPWPAFICSHAGASQAPELACGKQDRWLLAAFNPAPLARNSQRRDKMWPGTRDVTSSAEPGSVLSFCHKRGQWKSDSTSPGLPWDYAYRGLLFLLLLFGKITLRHPEHNLWFLSLQRFSSTAVREAGNVYWYKTPQKHNWVKQARPMVQAAVERPCCSLLRFALLSAEWYILVTSCSSHASPLLMP